MIKNTVSQICKSIDQPRGGYLPLRVFTKENGTNTEELKFDMLPVYVGKIVDALLKMTFGVEVEEVLKFSKSAYDDRVMHLAHIFYTDEDDIKRTDASNGFYVLQEYIKEKPLNKDSYADIIKALYKVFQYDIWTANPEYARQVARTDYKPKECSVNDISNILVLFIRTLDWIDRKASRRVVSNYKFYPNGYTEEVKYGIGDFILDNTLFELKCVQNVTTKHTLQLLIYYCMALHSNNKVYKYIDELSIYNPLLDTSYSIEVKDISQELIDTINNEIIKYEE